MQELLTASENPLSSASREAGRKTLLIRRLVIAEPDLQLVVVG